MVRGASLLLLALVSCVQQGESAESVTQPIIGGARDDRHPAVVAIVRDDGALCSGVLVAPRIALTAGHCVWGATPSRLVVVVGADVTMPEAKVAVSRIALYPTARQEGDDAVGGVDLAAIEVVEDLTPTPLRLVLRPLSGSLRDRQVTAVGFGRRDPFDAMSAGVRQAVATSVFESCTRVLRLGDDVENVCAGDSGGPVLLDGEVIALVSGGRDGCNTPSHVTRLDAHRVWLSRVIERRFTDPCPECVEPDRACDAPIEASVAAPSEPSQSPGCGVSSANNPPFDGSIWVMMLALSRALRRRVKGLETAR